MLTHLKVVSPGSTYKGSRQKKRSFYGQADRKGLPYWSGNTPLSGEVRQHIFRVCF